MKILLTGGSGLLGKELIKLDNTIYAPSHHLFDICYPDIFVLTEYKPDVIVHAAAFIGLKQCEEDKSRAYRTNILGTINMVNTCNYFGIKLVYISTDYVFDGERGDYDINDPINPLNTYAKTKTAGELVVRTIENSLAIRTSFCPSICPYKMSPIDQITNRDYIDVIAPLVYKQIISTKTGIVHVGTEKKTVFDLVKRRNKDILPTTLDEINKSGVILPKNVSMIIRED